MKRKQLYLPGALDALLAQRARAEGVPEAEIVRQALQAHLAAPADAADPLLALVGMARSRET